MLWVLAVTGIVIAVILSRIDDWGRDFSTNVAQTGENAKIRPLRLTVSPDAALERMKSAVSQMSNWQWIDETKVADGHLVNLVRSTTVFRFKDDVQVTITPDSDTGGTVLNAISRSRVGKGDLGQNPRNIKELFAKIEAMRE
jgi:uncharacterized protein (DUF1499 family)